MLILGVLIVLTILVLAEPRSFCHKDGDRGVRKNRRKGEKMELWQIVVGLFVIAVLLAALYVGLLIIRAYIVAKMIAEVILAPLAASILGGGFPTQPKK